MSCNLRIEYPGAMYHVMNRGDQREDIFRDEHDRQKFLTTLGEACVKTEWQVHAYCLMRNHFLGEIGGKLVRPTLRGALLGLEIGTSQGTLPVRGLAAFGEHHI